MNKYIKISNIILTLSIVSIIILLITGKGNYKNIEKFYSKIKPNPNLKNILETYKIKIKNDKTKYYKDLVKFFPNDKTYKDILNNTPIYIINLDRSKDRHKFMTDQMNNYKITNYQFISAVDGKKIKKRKDNMYDYEDITFFNNDDTVTNGELGCVLSHCKAISDVLKSNHEYAIICEDDADLFWIRTWYQSIENIINKAPDNWERISLYQPKPDENNIKNCVNYYIPTYDFNLYSGTCYLINRNGCKKLMKQIFKNNMFILDKYKTKKKRDKWYKKRYVVSDVFIPYLLNSYHLKYGLITGYNSDTVMNSTLHAGHTDHHVKCNTQNQENLTKNFLKTKKYEIPKIIHVILLSENERLKHINDTKYSNYNIKIWTHKDINKLNMINKNSYDSIIDINGKRQIALYEILYRYGGFYFDKNMNNFLNEIHDMPNMLNISKRNDELITTDFIATTKNHPFLKFIIDKLSDHYNTYYIQDSGVSVGNKYLTRMLQMLQNKDDVSPPGIKIGV